MSNPDTHYDIAVIGAGVAGLSAACFLSPQARVVVLERESQPAYHASGRSAAMYIEGYENPLVSELTSAGKSFFFSPPAGMLAESGPQQLVNACGGLTAAGPGELPKLKKYLSAWQPLCPDLVEISAAECRQMVPILKPSWLQGAAYDPSWHSIDVHELLSVYQRGLRAAGGHLLTSAEVCGLQRRNGLWHITTVEEEISAGVVVNAGGAWAPQLGEMAGASAVPLTPMLRTAAIVPAPEPTPAWPLVHTISEDLYFKPESPGLMICPQDETPCEAMDAYPHEMDVAVAAQRFTDITDHPVQRVLHQWAGLRTFAPDRKPVIGFDSAAQGFYWLAGQGGFGVQTSPGIAAVVAEDLLQGKRPPREMTAQRF